MGEPLFEGWVFEVITRPGHGDRALVTIATEDFGDISMAQRVTVIAREKEATDG